MTLKKRTACILALVAALLMAAPAGAVGAGPYEYKDYEVKRGDTLWDISNAELADPFNWPIVWKENDLDIENPDLIYPGQIIRIPLYLLKKPIKSLVVKTTPPPAPAPEAPAPVVREIDVSTDIMQVSADDILRSGFITKDPPFVGTISSSPGRRIVFGPDDEVYIKTNEPTEVGKQYYITRRENKVSHPLTGRGMGVLVKVMGVLEVSKVGKDEITARVLKAFDDVEVGDILDDYFPINPIIITGEPRKPELTAVVVASSKMKVLNSLLEIVYIDAGSEAGLLPGDVFVTLAPGTPDRPNGVIQVLNTKAKTSSAMILSSTNDVSIKDDVVGANSL